MKLTITHIRYIFLFSLFLLIFNSCKNNKEIFITGYAYKGDVITIYNNEKVIYNSVIDLQKDKSGITTLYERFQVSNERNDLKLRVTLDSSGIKLIDSIILIPKNNIEPFILFSHPEDVNFKREVSIDDDSKYIKY